VKKPCLDDIVKTPLSQFSIEGGNVLHAIKEDDAAYDRFGEVYFSFINHKAVKAWKLHKRMTLNLVVPFGNVRFVFCDPLITGNYRVEDIGEKNYVRLTVPPGIWFGFQGIATHPSLVTNIANLQYDPTEVERQSISSIDYYWEEL
jgi:dTDP-4-dehydrorhamnose 3,5-epimerase